MTLCSFQKAYALLLRQERKYSLRRIAVKSGMSKSSVHRICKENNIFRQGTNDVDSMRQCREVRRKLGPKPKLNARDNRMLLRTTLVHRRSFP